MAEPKDIISIAILKQKSSIQVALKAAFYYFFIPKNTAAVSFPNIDDKSLLCYYLMYKL